MAPVIEYSSSSSDPLGSGSVVEFEREGLTATTYLLASANPKKRAGRTKFRETRHPVYRGVRRRDGGKWVCEVRNSKNKSKSRLWLGTYPTAEMAARAHDVAVLALRGRSACLNFADSAWRLPIPDTGCDADIRAAAAEAAEAFRPRESEEETASCSSSSYEDACSVSDAESSSEAVTAEDDLGGSESQSSSYLDEEAIFFMPELLVDMAEGLMMSPPPIVFGDGLNWDGDHQFCVSDVPIWNF